MITAKTTHFTHINSSVQRTNTVRSLRGDRKRIWRQKKTTAQSLVAKCTKMISKGFSGYGDEKKDNNVACFKEVAV